MRQCRVREAKHGSFDSFENNGLKLELSRKKSTQISDFLFWFENT